MDGGEFCICFDVGGLLVGFFYVGLLFIVVIVFVLNVCVFES